MDGGKVSGKRKIQQSLRWLHDMKSFYEELMEFLPLIPTDVSVEHISRIPREVEADSRFLNLCRVSRDCTYMSGIPLDHCREAVETVQDLSREVCMAYHKHPVLRNITPWADHRPFFERTMVLGSSLGVEHNIDVDQAIRENRRKRRKGKAQGGQQRQPGSGAPSKTSDDEMDYICKSFDMDKRTEFSN